MVDKYPVEYAGIIRSRHRPITHNREWTCYLSDGR